MNESPTASGGVAVLLGHPRLWLNAIRIEQLKCPPHRGPVICIEYVSMLVFTENAGCLGVALMVIST